MNNSWEEILGKKFQNDSVSPPKSAWEQIQDSSWQNALKNKAINTQAPEIPIGLKHAVFKKVGISNGLWGLGLKTAAIIGGISISAAGLFWVNQNSQKIKTEESHLGVVEKIETKNTLDKKSSPDKTPHNDNEDSHNPIEKPGTTHFLSSRNNNNFRIQEPYSNSKNISIASSENESESIVDPLEFQSKLWEGFTVFDISEEIIPKFKTPTQAKRISPIKPEVQFYIGGQNRLGILKTNTAKERINYTIEPIQRQLGLILGLTYNKHWTLESGIFKSMAQSNLSLIGVPFYKTPVKIFPQRKSIEVNSPYHQNKIDASKSDFLPQGANWRDTSKYYLINFKENHRVQFTEIPLSIGYKYDLGRFNIKLDLGGVMLVPRRIDSDFLIELQNPKNDKFVFNNSKMIRNKYQFSGFSQLQIGCYIKRSMNLYINGFLPTVIINDTPKPINKSQIRFQMGLNYYF